MDKHGVRGQGQGKTCTDNHENCQVQDKTDTDNGKDHENGQVQDKTDTDNHENGQCQDKTDTDNGKDHENGKAETGLSESEVPPDGGYGWLVVLGCFLAHVVSGGIERSDGVAYLQFLKRFNKSAQLTAWPGALMSTMNLCLAPVAGIICNRYSVRTSVMIGGLMISAGCILNGYATNLYFLFFSHSFLVGCGRGLCYTPGLILVAMYFDKRRGFATGLGTSGVGVGTFLLAPVAQFLFDNFGYQSTFLIFGGIALNMNVSAMLFRPLSMHYRLTKTRDKEVGEAGHVVSTQVIVDTDTAIELESLKSRRLADDQQYNSKELESLTNSQNKQDQQYNSKELESLTNSQNKPDQQYNSKELESLTNSQNKPDQQYNSKELESLTNSQNRHNKNQIPKDNCLCSSLKICFPTEYRRDKNDTSRRLCHLYLLKNPSFLLYCLSVWLFTMTMKSAFMFIPALVKFKGISESEAALVLSVAGAVDALARIGAGFVLDTKRLRPYRSILYNMIMFAIALVAFVLPSLETFTSFLILCSVYGILTGAYISQKSIIVIDILGIKHMANSLGILICFQSFGTLLGPPLSGALKDHFGSFTEAFYLGGGFMLAAGGLMLMSNIFLRMRSCTKRRRR